MQCWPSVMSTPAAGEYEVTIPLRAGPVIPDAGNDRLVQIRDLSGEGRRELSGEGGFPPTDVAYDATGRLWVALEQGDVKVYDNLSDIIDPANLPGETTAIAVDDDRGVIYLWHIDDWGQETEQEFLYYGDLNDFTFPDDIGAVSESSVIDATNLGIELGLDEGPPEETASIIGMDAHDSGDIIAAVNVVGGLGTTPWIVRINPTEDPESVVVTSAEPGDLGWGADTTLGATLVRDIAVIEDDVFATLAYDGRAEVIRLRADLDPDSVEVVTPDGDDWQEYSDQEDEFSFFELPGLSGESED